MATEIRVPEVSDGVTEGTVISVNVKAGDKVEADQTLLEMETDKAVVAIPSPFDGVIVQKLVEQGDTVQPGQPLMKVAYVAYLRIQAEVPVGLVSSLRIGEFLPARIDVGQGVPVQARVSQIFPMADTSRHTVTVKFDLPSGLPGGPGMYAEVMIPDHSTLAAAMPSVPREAIVWRGSLPAVMILKDGKPTLRVVRIGTPMPDGRLTILSGLEGGEQVILQNSGPATAGPSQTMQAVSPGIAAR